MYAIQLLIIVFGIFAFSRLILRRKDRAVTLGETLMWSIIWIGMIAVAVNPSIVNLIERTGINQAMNLLVYLCIIALFYINFRLYIKVETQQQNITRLVREIALQKKK